MWRQVARPLALVIAASNSLFAQSPRRAEELLSLGQPSAWQLYAVPGGVRAADKSWRGALSGGVHRPITNPVTGLLGVAGELYASIDPGVHPGARLLATSRVLGLAAGADWDQRG